MAGHYPLSKIEEPEIFEFVEKHKLGIYNIASTVPKFKWFENPSFGIMALSAEYVENPLTEIAASVGKFSLKSMTDQHSSITQNINLEVHLEKVENKVSIKNIFWVA